MTDDLTKLREAAEGAAAVTSLAAVIGGERWRLDDWPSEVVEFIAEADPPTILALLDRLQAAENIARLAEESEAGWRREADEQAGAADEWEQRAKAAEDAVARVRDAFDPGELDCGRLGLTCIETAPAERWCRPCCLRAALDGDL